MSGASLVGGMVVTNMVAFVLAPVLWSILGGWQKHYKLIKMSRISYSLTYICVFIILFIIITLASASSIFTGLSLAIWFLFTPVNILLLFFSLIISVVLIKVRKRKLIRHPL